jgi:hypothetical protein
MTTTSKFFLDIVQLEPVSFVLLSDKFWRRRTKFFVAAAAAVPGGLANCCCKLVKPTAASVASAGWLAYLGAGLLVQNWTFST